MTSTVVAVAGGAKVTKRNLVALLSDFFRIDQDDEKDFIVFLPAHEDYTSEVVELTADWLVSIDGGYSVVHEDPTPRKYRRMVNEADDAYPSTDITKTLIDQLVQHRKAGDEVYLFLAWGDDTNAPDGATGDLFELAFDANIDVRDLTLGLQEIVFDDPSIPHEEEPEEEPEPPKRTRKARELKTEEKELTEKPDEAQAEIPPVPSPDFPDLATTLGFVAKVLDGYDFMESASNLSPHVRSPLNEAVRYHLRGLLESKPSSIKVMTEGQTASEPVQETLPDVEDPKPAKRRGKPRDTSSDELVVYVDDKKKTLKIYGGRGRPPRTGTKTEMLRSEYDELLNDGYKEL